MANKTFCLSVCLSVCLSSQLIIPRKKIADPTAFSERLAQAMICNLHPPSVLM